jgi:hypothetical protein
MCVDETGKVVHSGDCFSVNPPPGTHLTVHTVTCTAKDACGNIVTCTFKIYLFC